MNLLATGNARIPLEPVVGFLHLPHSTDLYAVEVFHEALP
jgi:hypothetical protein